MDLTDVTCCVCAAAAGVRGLRITAWTNCPLRGPRRAVAVVYVRTGRFCPEPSSLFLIFKAEGEREGGEDKQKERKEQEEEDQERKQREMKGKASGR